MASEDAILIYLVEDPSGELNDVEELAFCATAKGIEIFQAEMDDDDEDNFSLGESLTKWDLDSTSGLQSEKQSDDPEDMDLVNITHKSDRFQFECDDAQLVIDAVKRAKAAAEEKKRKKKAKKAKNKGGDGKKSSEKSSRSRSRKKESRNDGGDSATDDKALDELRECFKILDLNNDGCITFDELRTVMRSILYEKSHAVQLFAALDRDGDAQITLDEFVAAASDLSTGTGHICPEGMVDFRPGVDVHSLKQLRAAFEAVDMDESGFIDASELVTAMKNINPSMKKLDEATTRQMFARMDTDISGELDFREFVGAFADGSMAKLGIALAGIGVDASEHSQALLFADPDDPSTHDSGDPIEAFLAEPEEGTEAEHVCGEWEEECMLLPNSAGLLVFDAESKSTYAKWDWSALKDMKATKQSDDPSDMEVIELTVVGHVRDDDGGTCGQADGLGSAEAMLEFEVEDAFAAVKTFEKLSADSARAAAARTLERLARGKGFDKKRASKAAKGKKGPNKHRRDLKSNDPLKFFTQLQVAKLRCLFQVCDIDASGTISSDELGTILMVLGLDDDADNIMQRLDSDGDGDVSFDEFMTQAMLWEKDELKAQMQNSKGKQHQAQPSFYANARCDIVKIREAFEICDEDSSGVIEADELKAVVENLGESLSDDDLEKLLKVLDTDGSGEVEWTEFLTAIARGDVDKLGICDAFKLVNVDKLKQQCSSLEAKIAKQHEETDLAEHMNELLKQRIAELEKEIAETREDQKAADGADDGGKASSSPSQTGDGAEEGKDSDAKSGKKKEAEDRTSKDGEKKGEASGASEADGKPNDETGAADTDGDRSSQRRDSKKDRRRKGSTFQWGGSSEELEKKRNAALEDSKKNPAALIGWRLVVEIDSGEDGDASNSKMGTVKSVHKDGKGKATMHVVQCDDGTEMKVALDRKGKGKGRGKTAFTLVTPPANDAFVGDAAKTDAAASPSSATASESEKQEVLTRAIKAPEELINWRVMVTLPDDGGKQVGLITAKKKGGFGKATKFEIQLDNGEKVLLALDRKGQGKGAKGKCAFSLIMKVVDDAGGALSTVASPEQTDATDGADDEELQSVVKAAKADPKVLIGWRIEVLGKGAGVVKRVEGTSKAPEHVMKTDDGSEVTVALDLDGDGEGKGTTFFLKEKVE